MWLSLPTANQITYLTTDLLLAATHPTIVLTLEIRADGVQCSHL